MKKRLVSLLLAVVLVLGLMPTALAANYNFDSKATIFTQNFTTETPQEVAHIVRAAQRKLDGKEPQSLFRKETDTRGHYNKEII